MAERQLNRLQFYRSGVFFSLVSGLFAWPSGARAAIYDMYRADYTKGAFCVAIAGACASDDNNENSFYQNPAALEVGEPELVYDADFNPSDNLEPGMKVGNKINNTMFTGGLAHAGTKWGFGIAFAGLSSKVDATSSITDSGTGESSTALTSNSNYTVLVNFPWAYRQSSTFMFGVALNALYYQESFVVTGSPKSSTKPVDRFPQLGFTFGILFTPNKLFRFGSWLRTPLTYYVDQSISTQIGTTQTTIDELVGLHYPLISSNGVSFMPWSDQRTVFFDLDVVGSTENGQERTLDRFSTLSNAQAVLRPKGRQVAIEPHLAWRAPWWNGSRGTYTAGSYYENGRWSGLSGRLHGVTSFAYKFSFLESVVALDVAKDYYNFQFSFR